MTDDQIKAALERAEKATIPGYDGYEADADGRIWSAVTNWRGYGRRRLSEEQAPDGYLRVRLYRYGRRIRKQVHRLVALAYRGLPSLPESEVRHLNGIRTDNRPSNLVWGAAKLNAADRDIHGMTAIGSRNGQARLHEAFIEPIRRSLAAGNSQRRVAASYGVSQRTIGNIAQGKAWSHVPKQS